MLISPIVDSADELGASLINGIRTKIEPTISTMNGYHLAYLSHYSEVTYRSV
jgi:hypothetical protein